MEEKEELKNDEKINAITHKDSSLKRLDKSFINHIENHEYKKSNLLAYWINDFANYHDDEKNFKPENLKYFKRGDIIKVNLGFNIGNELGGLHYCVVINKKDNKKSGTLNVIPLTSIKEGKTYNNSFCLNLGKELHFLLLNKHKNLLQNTLNELSNIIRSDLPNMDKLKGLYQQFEYLKKIEEEINKMKSGSIALLHQITTISKQRIYNTNILRGIKLSDESMDMIDNKIKELFVTIHGGIKRNARNTRKFFPSFLRHYYLYSNQIHHHFHSRFLKILLVYLFSVFWLFLLYFLLLHNF